MPKRNFGTGTSLPTTKDTADETTSISTPAGATSPFETTESKTPTAFTNQQWKQQDSLQRPVSHDGSATDENSAWGNLEARSAARAEKQLSSTRLTRKKKVLFEPSNQDAPHGSQIFVEETAAAELSTANVQIITPDENGSLKVELDGHWTVKFADKARSDSPPDGRPGWDRKPDELVGTSILRPSPRLQKRARQRVTTRLRPASGAFAASYRKESDDLGTAGLHVTACVERALDLQRLANIQDRFWIVGLPFPPHALHHQLFLGREVFVTEQMYQSTGFTLLHG